MPHKRAKRSIREADLKKKGFNHDPSAQQTGSSAYVDDTPRGGARILKSIEVRAAYHARRSGGEGAASSKGAKSSTSSKSMSSKLAPNSAKPAKPPTSDPSAIPKIIPGESLGEYNRRIEAHMRPLVSQAIKSAQVKKSADEKAAWMEKRERRLEDKEKRKEAKARREREAEEGEEGSAGDGSDGQAGVHEKSRGAPSPSKADREPGRKGPNGIKRPRANEEDPISDAEASTSKHPIKTFANASSQTRRSINDIAHAPPILPGLKRAPKAVKDSEGKGAFQPTGRTPLNAGQARIMEEERERVIKRYREMKESKRVQWEEEKEAEARAKRAPKKRKVSA